MKRDDVVYLHHILAAISRIQEYLAGVTYDQFIENYLLQDGVVRQLEIIGEATRNISSDFQSLHSDLPWDRMVAIRNRLAHAYFEVNLAIIWDTAQVNLPPLRTQVERLLEKSGGE